MTAEVTFVLTLDEVSSWAYFYVLFPSVDGHRAVKYASHRFETVASLKGQIQAFKGLRANSFELSHDTRGNSPLADLSNIFHSGTPLYCVYKAP